MALKARKRAYVVEMRKDFLAMVGVVGPVRKIQTSQNIISEIAKTNCVMIVKLKFSNIL